MAHAPKMTPEVDLKAPETKKISVHVSPEIDAILQQISEERSSTKSESVRIAIKLLGVALDASRNGQQLAVVDEDGQVTTKIVGI